MADEYYDLLNDSFQIHKMGIFKVADHEIFVEFYEIK